MGGQAEGKACADLGARTPISVTRISQCFQILFHCETYEYELIHLRLEHEARNRSLLMRNSDSVNKFQVQAMECFSHVPFPWKGHGQHAAIKLHYEIRKLTKENKSSG